MPVVIGSGCILALHLAGDCPGFLRGFDLLDRRDEVHGYRNGGNSEPVEHLVCPGPGHLDIEGILLPEEGNQRDFDRCWNPADPSITGSLIKMEQAVYINRNRCGRLRGKLPTPPEYSLVQRFDRPVADWFIEDS